MSLSSLLILILSGIRALYVVFFRDLFFYNASTNPQSDVEGPETLLFAPLRRDQLYDGDVQGEPLIFTVNVIDSKTKEPIEKALVEAWHNDITGGYSNFDYQFRGKFVTSEDGRITFRTIKPPTLEIPGLNAVVNTIRRWVGKSEIPLKDGARRPAHIHWHISAPGYSSYYSQTYFEDNTWGFDLKLRDSASASILDQRRATTLKVKLTQDKQENVWKGNYTFMLNKA